MPTKWVLDDMKALRPAAGRSHPHFGRTIYLLTPAEFARVPDGMLLVSIAGREYVKGLDRIDDDTRHGYMAVGLVSPALVKRFVED